MMLKTVIPSIFLKDVTLKVNLDMGKILMFMINDDLCQCQKAWVLTFWLIVCLVVLLIHSYFQNREISFQ